MSLVHRWVMWVAVGLTSTFSEPTKIRRRDIPHIIGLFLVGLPGGAFVVIPFVLVSVWIGLFYVADGTGWLIDRTLNKLRPRGERERVNTPKLGWRLS